MFFNKKMMIWVFFGSFLLSFPLFSKGPVEGFLEKHILALSSAEVSLDGLRIPFTFSLEPIAFLAQNLTNNEESLQDLIRFWNENKALICKNPICIREFSILLFSLYQHVLWKLSRKQPHKAPLLGMLSLYFKLQALPLPALFSSLDTCLSAYSKILKMHKFPFRDYDKMSGWFLENWWVPTMFLVSGLIAWQRWKSKRDDSAKNKPEMGQILFEFLACFYR